MSKVDSEKKGDVESVSNFAMEPLEPLGHPVLDANGGWSMQKDMRNLLYERGQGFVRDDSLIGSEWDHLSGTPKECFKNAAEAALENPDELRYVEGYAISALLGFPVEHAWVIDNDDNVIDKTWSDGISYYGIIFDRPTIVASMIATGCYGILVALWHSEEVRNILEVERLR